MKLECCFYGPFRDAIGEKSLVRETDCETVGDLLAELEEAYPALEGEILADDGSELAGDTVVSRNGRHVVHLDGLATDLEDGDVIRLVPSVYGG
ncbi:ubiquitin-like small modifier protein 1 [Natrarchaeobaculum aegyptiacum]|uniref:Thiamine biosynthesis protein ThiS n=1 Tax=Natrarchaeobaculum aegyptiacum TaxID=745377 RepID=A0A2Z2HWS2_9EURY|nr:ubiquitin-like small modifier protein 1 [Natrarchaeobaculum aegyptiacum]ARS91313.1 thiamine biosynthesis protein ThiS [Natrarchaeobaculum aegyptiacum]